MNCRSYCDACLRGMVVVICHVREVLIPYSCRCWASDDCLVGMVVVSLL